MPPFFAPGISGAGPLAFGSRAAPAVSTLPPLPLAPPDVPLLAAGAPQAATKPREAAAPTVRTLVQRICCLLLLRVPAFYRELLVGHPLVHGCRWVEPGRGIWGAQQVSD